MKKITKVIFAATAVALLVSSAAFAKPKKEKKSKKAEAPAPIVNPDPTGTVDLLDGAEEGVYWLAVADSWGNGDTSIDVGEYTKWASEGSTSLLLDFSASNPANAANAGDKATFFCDALAIVDFTEYKQVVLDINNPTGKAIDFVLVIQDTDWTWCQSAAQSLGAGVNKNVTFNLADLKIPNPTAVHRMAFCLFQEHDGPIYVDNIRLVK